MLPARRLRTRFGILELVLVMLAGENLAYAQASAAPPAAATPEASPATTVASAPAGNSLESETDEPALPTSDVEASRPPPATRWLLIGTGLAMTGAFYAGAQGIGELWPDAPGRHDLRYPVAGPFMDLARTGCPASDSDCSTLELVLRTIVVSLDALGQVGGVGLVLQGAVLGTANANAPRTLGNTTLRRPADSFSFTAVPWSDGRSGGGLSLTGRF